MVDPNEVTGFLIACRNVDYLLDLRNHIDERLLALGASSLQPRQMQPLPSMQDGRQSGVAAFRGAPVPPQQRQSSVTPPPPQAQPDVVSPDPAGTVGVMPAEQARELVVGEEKRIVIGPELYTLKELSADGVRLGFDIQGKAKGGHYFIETAGDRITCDCPDFLHRHAKAGPEDVGCKHVMAARLAFKLPAPKPIPVKEPAREPEASSPEEIERELERQFPAAPIEEEIGSGVPD